MKSSEMGPIPEQEKLNIGKKIADLIKSYADPQDSKRHAAIASKIREAIQGQNRDELILQLGYFGNARNNVTGTEGMQMVEMSCSLKSQAIISDLNKTEGIPWDELSTSLGVAKRPTQESVSPKKPELSPEDIKNAEVFINAFILHNDSLTPQAKELVINEARSERGPWSLKDFVESISLSGNKVTIKTKSGEAYLYVK